ncbi:MAG: ABC transporter permease [Thermoleophilaceae bacterium]|nr:ABC transporter permease [Thermoleophilaceae bacterium]
MAKGGDVSIPLASVFSEFGGAIEFLFKAQPSDLDPNTKVGGVSEMLGLLLNHVALSGAAVAIGTAIAIPLGLYLGHHGKGEFAAINASNVGRAIPTLVLLTVFIAYIGVGFVPIMLALALLALPPVLTNTWVAARQVERETVDAARGMGMTDSQIIQRVELPLSLPTIFAGIRVAAVNVVATATIAPLGSVDSLGTPIISGNVYGADGRLGAAIAVSVLTLAVSGALAALQRAITPKGLKMGAEKPRRRFSPNLRRRETATP